MSDRLPGIRPRPTLGRRLDISARFAFPAVSTALFMMLFGAPLGLPGQAQLQNVVALSAVFFWSLFRPASMPPHLVFVLGLLADLLGFAPPGVGVITLLIAHGCAMRWRRKLARQGFFIVWIVFGAIAFGAALLQWALTSLLTFSLLPPGPALFQAQLAAGLYPALAILMTRAHQSLADPGQA